jgi:SAM-dependent methyltransferase
MAVDGVKKGARPAAEIFERLTELARQKTLLLSDIWRRTSEEFGDAWVEEIVESFTRLFGSEENDEWELALRSYRGFALDAMRSQQFFEAHGHYRWSTLDGVRQQFYENEQYMLRSYLPGLYLSTYLWPHHFRLLTFFRQDVLPHLASSRLIYDVGVGTGVYSRETLRAFPRARGKGFDISPNSIAFAGKVLEAYGLADRYEFVLGDILTAKLPQEAADLVIGHEVLEHLEEPNQFCEIMRRLTRAGGSAYLTAAVNAAHSDHIYLFRSPQEVYEMLRRAGWEVLKWRAEYAYVGEDVSVTPCVVGFLCGRG